MVNKVKVAMHYKIRIGIMVLGMLIFGGLFLKDGFISYPDQAKAYHSLEALKVEFENPSEHTSEIQIKWDKIASENHWPTEMTMVQKRTDADIVIQKVLGFVLLVCFAFFGFGFFKTLGRWIGVDDEGVSSSGEGKILFKQIKALDKKRRAKRISYVISEDGTKITVDSWIFEEEGADAILRAVESNIDHQLITGGAAESVEKSEDDDQEQTEEASDDSAGSCCCGTDSTCEDSAKENNG